MPLNLSKIRTKGIKGFSQETKYQILELLDIQFRAEKEIEKLREELNIDPNKSPLTVFRKFDSEGKGRITKKDIRKAFQKIGYCLSTNESSLLFARFHKKNQ
mmetsp:Transcript_19078/g.16910  ORF Transcript_19078/g.16910 Transcript_19078/m.16910 type:complete len:102 (-) Transcript_19078:22-327(-)